MDSALGPPDKMRERREELTPMMAQYFELCEQYDDALVLFQVGDFYEAFCEAAETVARRCEITLTKREDSTGQYAMAGVPVDNAESYIERLLDAGYRVAVADQVEEPEATSGVVDRAVTRIVTPGTLTEAELLDDDRNNFVAAVAGRDRLGLAVLDVSTGEFYATSAGDAETIADELGRFDPAEAIVGPDAPTGLFPEDCPVSPYDPAAFDREEAGETLRSYFGSPETLLAGDAEIRACGAVLSYAEYARGGEDGTLPYLNHLTRYDPREYMLLDAVALESLELFDPRTVHGREDATLAGVVDETASAIGRRTVDEWLRRPLLDRDAISARHDAVEQLRDSVRTREQLQNCLAEVYDIERLISRIARGRANARDLRALAETLAVVPEVRDLLADPGCEKLADLRERLDPLEEVRSLIDDAIQEDPAREITEGGVINPEYDDDLAVLRETERSGKAWVDRLEESERERTGIDSLKVGHNTVHGYYIEVTDPNLDSVPDDYERRQTLKNAERYYTPELKAREEEILQAESRADELEYELFCSVRSTVGAESERVQSLADALAELDALVAFGTVAAEYDYCRPTFEADRTVRIEDGRHPVVERTQESFVPNDTALDESSHLAVITGPNMSGKSTYMRQVALVAVLAQAGSFVPASDARLPIFDRVFTRVGASDDIAGGRSTFMVEMTELADILDNATERSLVLLDEVGRGTSTTDGFAIARAVTEFLHDEVGALTLFATHHHDLTAVAADLPRATNLHFETGHEDGDIVFEHELRRGGADGSYGVDVAEMAGVTSDVVGRARTLLEAERPVTDVRANRAEPQAETRPDLPVGRNRTDGGDLDRAPTDRRAQVCQHLLDIDIATMTPVEALTTLSELQNRLEDGDG
ncbi:DNA mismatch repair protein MutS [Halovenus marina]|uniref:DNA mismatch repair protein MutS n=1 Tax=Halovenus marina TaxID=3396621 RepID=UPI003F562236